MNALQGWLEISPINIDDIYWMFLFENIGYVFDIYDFYGVYYF